MQGFNMGRYVPPDQEGTTTGNALHKKHPLGARARHLKTTGALTVRFEMPFAVWCTTCRPHETLIGQGVRFNAEKKPVGRYHSTPVYSFRMKHAACGGWIEIRTDPRNTEYVVVEGGRRRDYGGADEHDGGEILVGGVGLGAGQSKEVDPFARLEGKVEDKRLGDGERERILELQARQARDWEDPYENSRRLRRGFREVRKGLEKKEADTQLLRDKLSLGIEVVDETEEDRVRAGLVEFGAERGSTTGTRLKPLFAPGKPSRSTGKVGDALENRKALFRNELRGNTRAAVDPFLSSDSSEWRPESKRRRTVASSRLAEEEARESSATPDSESARAAEATPLASAGLVDYASDSD
ncbi:hypothetical protein ASPACDRAFT_39981 [Aspergillus aculeatus ATCC 16872]|uniref:DUF572 domain-containing protein n=1 Tax=Aspergillus aculeatus (strain ATCC 16872 / CBS 172.66 / WB 5094) TaxID=690307 RepID=A0A1L9X2Y4_ASPA1|nr:uncharacterized protein ASPACDRAFT_39981 [Aspergillus aculeatus ATCC 16872]OJK02669.1 hypothetical protein ASPACDRAFT_39981 [Aspergillus aculeatus ATCC 16872]